MDKANAYLQKKNLEIPTSFRGKSFATLDTKVLAATSELVDIDISLVMMIKNAMILLWI